jgi:hypothetical protein
MFIVFAITNAAANTNDTVEHFIIDAKLKEQILGSPFKLPLYRKDGEKVIAYLFAEDEKEKFFEYDSCNDIEKQKTIEKSGNYHLYLYDEDTDSFFPYRTAILKDFRKIKMNIQGSHFIVLPHANKNQSDALLISQFVSCNGDQYEAYGFSENLQYLVPYTFVGKEPSTAFFGQIDTSEPCGQCFLAYTRIDPMIYQYSLSISNIPGEIRQELLVKDHI